MSYFFFLDKVQMPVPPAKLQLRIANKNKTINLINEGEVNVLKTPGLTEVSFEVLLPRVQYPFARYFPEFQPPEVFLKSFERFKIGYKPFQFIVCRLGIKNRYFLSDTNLKVTLEDYDIIEDAANGLDMLVSLRLKQYRPYGTKVLNIKNGNGETKIVSIEQQREASRELPKAYKTIAGQTLFEICKKQLGDGARWKEIAQLNRIVNPNNLKAGQVIKFVK